MVSSLEVGSACRSLMDAGSRPRNFSPGECVRIITAAAMLWSENRASRKGDKRMEETLLQACVDAPPLKNQAQARVQKLRAVVKIIKNMRSRLFAC